MEAVDILDLKSSVHMDVQGQSLSPLPRDGVLSYFLTTLKTVRQSVGYIAQEDVSLYSGGIGRRSGQTAKNNSSPRGNNNVTSSIKGARFKTPSLSMKTEGLCKLGYVRCKS